MLAVRCADLGYSSLSANDDPTAPGLEVLAQFAAGTPQIDLGVGVLPLDRHPPNRSRPTSTGSARSGELLLGIGSGRLRPAFQPVRAAVAELRQMLPDARVVVGAMRPALCHLGGTLADGVLLNWMLPAHAERARRWVHEGAKAEERTPPITACTPRRRRSRCHAAVHAEEGRYRRLTAAHFEAMNVPLGGRGRGRRSEVVDAWRRIAAVDLAIVRVLSGGDLPSLVAVAEAAAP